MRYNETYRFPFAAYPAVRIMLLMMAGIVFADLFLTTVFASVMLFTVSLAGWGLCEFYIRKKKSLAGGSLSSLFYLMVIFFAAFSLFQFHEYQRISALTKAAPIHLFEWDEVEIRGTVASVGRSGAGRPVYEVKVNQTTFVPGHEWNQPYNIRLYGERNARYQIQAGRTIHSKIRLFSFPDRRNPHEFDYGRWLQGRGIAAHGEVAELFSTENRRGLNWGPIRAYVQRNTDSLFDEEYAGLAKALLLGYKDELTSETKQEFARSGLSHIMAVSGLHVGFIVAPFWLLIPFLWGTKGGKWSGLILLTLLLVGYAGLTGFSPSVTRASLMAWLITYGKLFHKVRNSINLTAVAAIIILLIKPRQLFDVGFQLSFAAVFIILLLMPQTQQLIPVKYRFGLKGKFIAIILVSIVVQAGLFPILVTYFGEFSIIGPIANALVVPVLFLSVPVGLFLAVCTPLWPALFQTGARPVQYTLHWINEVAHSLGTRDFSYFLFDQTAAALFFVWLFTVFLVASVRIPQVRWKMLIGLLLSLNVFFVELAIRAPSNKTLEVTFLDVGQADAVHIRTPSGRHLLIDAGRWSPMGNSGDRVLLPYFENIGMNRLDAVILSHPHADHIGGMPSLLENMQISKIYQSDYAYDSDLYHTTMTLADQQNIPIEYPVAGDLIEVDPAIRFFVVGPEEGAARDRNPNNHSVAVKLVYGQTSFLFSGDAETEQEAKIAARYGDFLKSDVYKAGHHASNTSSTDVYMQFVQPELSVASLAFRNVFGHPGRDAVARLYQYSEHQAFTSLNGAIRLQSDGENIQAIQW